MSKAALTPDAVANKLYNYVHDCDVDELAAMFEFAFAAVKKANYNAITENIDFELEDGFTVDDI